MPELTPEQAEELRELRAAAAYITERLDQLAPQDNDEDEKKRADVAALRKKYPALRGRR